MLGFGRKSGYREGFGKIEDKIKEAEDKIHSGDSGFAVGETSVDDDHMPHGHFDYIKSFSEERLEKLRDKFRKMKDIDHAEAIKLEEKHNNLLQNVADAHKALEEFEKEQLGMGEANPEGEN